MVAGAGSQVIVAGWYRPIAQRHERRLRALPLPMHRERLSVGVEVGALKLAHLGSSKSQLPEKPHECRVAFGSTVVVSGRESTNAGVSIGTPRVSRYCCTFSPGTSPCGFTSVIPGCRATRMSDRTGDSLRFSVTSATPRSSCSILKAIIARVTPALSSRRNPATACGVCGEPVWKRKNWLRTRR